MDVQFGEYAGQLYNRGFSPLFSGDVPKVVDAIAEAGNLYPIEAIATSVILGVVGSVFGGMILTPIIFIAVSLFTTAGFCKETEVFMERCSRAYNHPTDTAEQRAQNLAALRQVVFQRTHGAELERVRVQGLQAGIEVARTVPDQYSFEAVQGAAVRLQTNFRRHRAQLQAADLRQQPPPPPPPPPPRTGIQKLMFWRS